MKGILIAVFLCILLINTYSYAQIDTIYTSYKYVMGDNDPKPEKLVS